MDAKFENGKMQILEQSGLMHVVFSGNFSEQNDEQYLSLFEKKLNNNVKTIKFEAENFEKWDSSLLLVIFKVIEKARDKNIAYDVSRLPKNLQKLIELAFAVDRKPTRAEKIKRAFIENIGFRTVKLIDIVGKVMSYLKEVLCSCWRFITFRSEMRSTDFFAAFEDCGPNAIGIVGLISFLVGLILAFVGAIQLQTFGAEVYVASLVTIGMTRIMGAIMVGIIMAGRTGSAFAATIGTMQVNEEIDALKTMGISTNEFLVMPRMLAIVLVMPLLTMLADFSGILGGAFVGIFALDIPFGEYLKFTVNAWHLKHFLVGVGHAFVFGFIIAIAGCYFGVNASKSADSVGKATTNAVVYGIVWMIIATGIITFCLQRLGI
ncbi:MAG: ABC transporter permease [Alphaproteobacteria bacterium]|nr:ABC transporter permease [Alphaproteobacteria bacterium]